MSAPALRSLRALVENRPGFAPERLIHLAEEAIAACRLDLSGVVVMTEGATLAYAITPVMAALAGADSVIAVAQSTPYGSVADITAQTMALASRAGKAHRIHITRGKREVDVRTADIVTNSGNVRPIDARTIGWMKRTAVVPLMSEYWAAQARPDDVDVGVLRRRGIAVAGTNERHPVVRSYRYLPAIAIRLLTDAGMSPYDSTVAVLCDNPFAGYLVNGLERVGARVSSATQLAELEPDSVPDVLLVAVRPTRVPIIDSTAAAFIARRWPTVVVVQLWGDIDRIALNAVSLRYWPHEAPRRGHVAMLTSDLGPDPVVRLQAAGLKVGEVLLKPAQLRTQADRDFLDDV
jgi:hypothetical protein